jgi:hypothetical protein
VVDLEPVAEGVADQQVLVYPDRRRIGRELAVEGHLVAGAARCQVGVEGGVVRVGTVAAAGRQQQR